MSRSLHAETLPRRRQACTIRVIMNTVNRNSIGNVNPDVTFLDSAITGLTAPQKNMSPKFLYDPEGSALFERICELEEYYVTRTEAQILQNNVKEIASSLGAPSILIEYGSGNSSKTEIVLANLRPWPVYVPIDVSQDALHAALRRLTRSFNGLDVLPVCADYTSPFDLPEPALRKSNLHSSRTGHAGRAAMILGSTIGNFEPDQLINFLSQCRRTLLGGKLLLGVDLPKDREILESAYNDREGVTAQFNLNLLARMNKELDAHFQINRFFHKAIYNEEKSRIEMHLVSREDQIVNIGSTIIRFTRGESIHTESSYKYSIEKFYKLAALAGFRSVQTWTDSRQLFSLHLLKATSSEHLR